MQLSLKEMTEILALLTALSELNHVNLGEITVYDGMGDVAGKLVYENENWSFEYGE